MMETGLNNKHTVFAVSTLQRNQSGREENRTRERRRSDDKGTTPRRGEHIKMPLTFTKWGRSSVRKWWLMQLASNLVERLCV